MENFILKRYVPFTSDYGFKVTFGNESDAQFLKRSLQALIHSEIPIKEIFFDKHQIEGLTETSRGGILDLFCKDEEGQLFIVEMQLGIYPNIVNRLKFYGFHKMDQYIRKGDFTFGGIPRMYLIGILGFNLLPGAEYHSISHLTDHIGRRVDSQMTLILVELEKFKKTPELCLTDLDKLLFTMKQAHQLIEGDQPPFMQEDWIQVALKRLDAGGLTPEQRSNLTIMVAQELSERHRIAEVEADARARGMVEGKAQGMAEGRAEGRAEGKAEGKAEGLLESNVQAIKNLILHTGWDDLKVSEVLALPIDFVGTVRKDLDLQ